MQRIQKALLLAMAAFLFLTPLYAKQQNSVKSLEKRYALIIGNNTYAEFEPLDNSVNDAIALSTILKKLDFTVTLKMDMNSSEAKATLENFEKSVKPGSAVFFYFSGHGVQIDGHNYLLTTDLKTSNIEPSGEKSKKILLKERIEQYSISLDSLVDIFQKKKIKTNIVILDACRKSPSKDLEAEGLASLDAPINSLISFATSPGKVSHALTKEDKNSLYTKHLLLNINKENTPVDQMLKKVHKSVYEFSKKVSLEERKDESLAQMPWINSSLIDDFYMNLSGPLALAGNEVGDTTLWYDVQNSEDISKIKGYIKKYPNGMYVLTAKKKVAELSKKQKIEKAEKERVYKFLVSKADTNKIINSAYFFTQLDKYLSDSENPIEEIRQGALTGNVLAKAWYCAVTTHDRYKTSVKTQESINACKDKSLSNLPIGKFLTGRAAFFGRGEEEDKEKAVSLIKKAALLGNPLAQNFMGDLYYEGLTVEKNHDTAFKWHMKSAQGGYLPAIHSIALAYEEGKVVIQNDFEAVAWYKKAAKGGYAWSQNNLAVHIINGKGATTDVNEALKWIELSAGQNNPQGKILFARLYESGVGVIQNIETAKSLYSEVIQSSNDSELIDVAERSLKRLTPTVPIVDKKD